MKFEYTQITGFENAFIGMRLPLCKDYHEARAKCNFTLLDPRNVHYEIDNGLGVDCFSVDTDTLRVAENLVKADSTSGSQPNSKFLRMIHVQTCITAPLYWWKEADTYKVGTTANSTSTMHTLSKYPITKDCFEMGDFSKHLENFYVDLLGIPVNWEDAFLWNVDVCEQLRQRYNKTKDKIVWKELIRWLPESWLQTRMFDCDYATLRNMYHWRKNHKLKEWSVDFVEWCKTLPFFKELIEN